VTKLHFGGVTRAKEKKGGKEFLERRRKEKTNFVPKKEERSYKVFLCRELRQYISSNWGKKKKGKSTPERKFPRGKKRKTPSGLLTTINYYSRQGEDQGDSEPKATQ